MQTQDFLKALHIPGTIVQVGQVNKLDSMPNGVNDYVANNSDKDLYFLGNVPKEKGLSRAKDADITTKRYVYFDFDVRKSNSNITDQEIKELAVGCGEKLQGTEYANFSFIVFSGNGFHIYYICEPTVISIDNYSNGYELMSLEIEKIVDIEADKACKNVARIARLPGSYNNKSDKRLVEILHVGEESTGFITKMQELGESEIKRLKSINDEEAGLRTALQNNSKYKSDDLINAINDIPVQQEVLRDFPEWSFDGKNFWNHDKTRATSAFISQKDEKVLVISDSRWFNNINHKGVSAFLYRREFSKMSNKETVEYYLENYPELEKYRSKNTEPVLTKVVKKDDRRYTWGTKTLNENFALIKRGTFMIMAAEQGVGKTTYAFFQARKNAEMGNKTLYLSLEMDNHEIADFLAREYSGITEGEEYNNTVPERKKLAYKRKKQELKDIDNLILSGVPKGTNISMQFIRDQVEQHNPDIVYIDNFDLVGRGSDDKRNEEKKSAEFMNIASVYQIPVIVLHHVRKKSGHNTEEKRTADDIRGSGKITDDSDRVVMLSRVKEPETEEEKAIFYLSLVKARGYNTKFKSIYFNKGDFQDEKPDNIKREENMYNNKIAEASAVFNK